MGQSGGGKGWCGRCLRTEDLERRGLFRDDHGHVFFSCRSCPRTVRVIKESKKQWRKGTVHLLKKRLCRTCFELEDNDGIGEDQSKKAVYDSSSNLESEEQAIRLSCHPEHGTCGTYRASTSKRNIKLAQKQYKYKMPSSAVSMVVEGFTLIKKKAPRHHTC